MHHSKGKHSLAKVVLTFVGNAAEILLFIITIIINYYVIGIHITKKKLPYPLDHFHILLYFH